MKKRVDLDVVPLRRKKVVAVDVVPLRKKKVTAVDISPPRKKKRVVGEVDKVENLPAVIEPPKKPRISKLNTKGMRSILGDSAEEIQQLLESNSNDSAITLMQKRMIQTVVDLLPYAEHAVRNSKGARGVYQINSLLTSLRELMIDMQSTKDKGTLGAEMVERVVRPAFLDIGMVIIQEEARLDGEIRDILGAEAHRKIKAARKESTLRIAQSIQEKFGQAKEQAINFLQG